MLGKGFDKPWPFILMSTCLVSGLPPAYTSVIWALNRFAPISCAAHLDQLPETLQIRIFQSLLCNEAYLEYLHQGYT